MENNLDYKKIIKKNITISRQRSGLTQEQLANLVYISKSYMSKIEAPNSNKIPSLDVLIALSKSLSIPITALFEE